MYQPNLQHILAKSTMPRTVQDYNAALASAGGFLAEIEKAHSNPLPGDPLAKSTFSESTSPTSGLTYYDLELGAKFLYPLLTPLRNETPRVSGKGGIQANWRAVIRTRQDYYQIEWPPRARRYESGVYADEVLQHYFPPSMAVISNIAAG